MPSVRKRLSMALGFNGKGPSSQSTASSMDTHRRSIDSGYHSMIAEPNRGNQGSVRQETTFISQENPPRQLRKAISTTFSGAIQAFSNTVRSTTSYIYPTPRETDLPSSEWAECETPKNQSPRPSIRSSFRSRKQRSTPRTPGAKLESPERLQSTVPVTQEEAPALDVDIPNPSFSYESLERVSATSGSQLLAGVKLPGGPKNLWPGPTRLTDRQASDDDRKGILYPVATDSDDPYVEKGDGRQHGLSSIHSPSGLIEFASPESFKRCTSEDKGDASDWESNADVSGSEGGSPACLKFVAPGSPEAKDCLPCRHKNPAAARTNLLSAISSREERIPCRVSYLVPSGSEASKPETLDGIAEQTLWPESPSLRCKTQATCLKDGPNAFSPPDEATSISKTRTLNEQLTSGIHDVNAKSPDLSMGSRAAWQRHRADRERRYTKIVDMDSDTESDEDMGPELELKRSPSKKPVHYAGELVQDTVRIRGSESTPRFPTGDLRYAIEAIERPAFPVGDIACAVETINTPSIMIFESLETMLEERPPSGQSGTIDEPKTLRDFDSLNVSVSPWALPWSPLADLSPSQIHLPWTPENSPVHTPAASPREQESNTAPNSGKDASLKAGETILSTYVSSRSKTYSASEDAFQAESRASGISMPIYPSDVIQRKPRVDNFDDFELKNPSDFTPTFKGTKYGAFSTQSGARYSLPKLWYRNDAFQMHSRMASTSSNSTDVSYSTVTHSPSCHGPPPFPSLNVQPEPASSIPSTLNTLGSHREERIRITGPADADNNLSLTPPFDGLKDQSEPTSSPLSAKASHCADLPEDNFEASSLEQRGHPSSSPSTKDSLQPPGIGNNTQQTFNAARLPSFGSPSPIASNKERRKQRKSLQLRRRNQLSTDEACLEDLKAIEHEERWLDNIMSARVNRKSPDGRGQAGETSLVRSNPQRMKPRVRSRTWSTEQNEHEESTDKDCKMHTEHSTGEASGWYENRRSGSTSYAGYELDEIFSTSPRESKGKFGSPRGVERRSDRACNCAGNLARKDGRPPWRP